MKNKRKKAIKFNFTIDRARLFEFAKMPVIARLKWLEETNAFLASITNRKLKKLWLAFKAG